MSFNTVTGRVKEDFTVGIDSYRKGQVLTFPKEYADHLEPVKQKIVSKATVDDVIRDKINSPKKVFCKKENIEG